MDLTQLLGPLGLTVAALVAATVLWREHQRADRDDRAQRDRALGLVEQIAPTLKDMASALEAINRRAASKGRVDDESA